MMDKDYFYQEIVNSIPEHNLEIIQNENGGEAFGYFRMSRSDRIMQVGL